MIRSKVVTSFAYRDHLQRYCSTAVFFVFLALLVVFFPTEDGSEIIKGLTLLKILARVRQRAKLS